MKITTDEALVKTLAVEVQVMKIGQRQVTQSVFRQLTREHIIDPDELEFKGVPWGRVNYYWGSCKDANPETHLHVVWQDGSELRRACVRNNPDSFKAGELKETSDEAQSKLIDIKQLHYLMKSRDERPESISYEKDAKGWTKQVVRWPDGSWCNDDLLGKKMINRIKDRWGDDKGPNGQWAEGELTKSIEARAEELKLNPDYQTVRNAWNATKEYIENLLQQRVSYCEKWVELFQELSVLDQLFIAC